MYSTRAFCKKRPEFGHCVSQRCNVIMLWCNITSWHHITSWCHIHGDGYLQTPVVYDYPFNLQCYIQMEAHEVGFKKHRTLQPCTVSIKNICSCYFKLHLLKVMLIWQYWPKTVVSLMAIQYIWYCKLLNSLSTTGKTNVKKLTSN